MTLKQIAGLGRKLSLFLALFADCFGRWDARALLRVYVKGQLSDLKRKTAEAIALRFKTAPRTLQRFLESIKWDEERLRDRCQQIIAKDHAHPEAIGCVDESGTAKSGRETVGVGRQWIGNQGKVDNGVVAVHLSYSACRKAGPMTPRAEKKLRAGGGRIPDQTDARAVSNRSRLVQRSVRFRLGFRRVVRSGQQVSRWLRIAEASIRRRDSNQLSWLGSEAKGVAKRPEKVGKTRPSQEVSTCSSSPAFKRSPESVEVLT